MCFCVVQVKSLKTNFQWEGVPASHVTESLYGEDNDDEENENDNDEDETGTEFASDRSVGVCVCVCV